MKRFFNRTHYLQKIKFKDGVVQFLQSGEQILSNKEYVFVSDGVQVTDEKKPTKRTKTTKSKDEKFEEVNE